jgi:hypothetical protein
MHVASLDKIRVSEPTTQNPELKTQEASLKMTECTGVDAGSPGQWLWLEEPGGRRKIYMDGHSK